MIPLDQRQRPRQQQTGATSDTTLSNNSRKTRATSTNEAPSTALSEVRQSAAAAGAWQIAPHQQQILQQLSTNSRFRTPYAALPLGDAPHGSKVPPDWDSFYNHVSRMPAADTIGRPLSFSCQPLVNGLGTQTGYRRGSGSGPRLSGYRMSEIIAVPSPFTLASFYAGDSSMKKVTNAGSFADTALLSSTRSPSSSSLDSGENDSSSHDSPGVSALAKRAELRKNINYIRNVQLLQMQHQKQQLLRQQQQLEHHQPQVLQPQQGVKRHQDFDSHLGDSVDGDPCALRSSYAASALFESSPKLMCGQEENVILCLARTIEDPSTISVHDNAAYRGPYFSNNTTTQMENCLLQRHGQRRPQPTPNQQIHQKPAEMVRSVCLSKRNEIDNKVRPIDHVMHRPNKKQEKILFESRFLKFNLEEVSKKNGNRSVQLSESSRSLGNVLNGPPIYTKAQMTKKHQQSIADFKIELHHMDFQRSNDPYLGAERQRVEEPPEKTLWAKESNCLLAGEIYKKECKQEGNRIQPKRVCCYCLYIPFFLDWE